MWSLALLVLNLALASLLHWMWTVKQKIFRIYICMTINVYNFRLIINLKITVPFWPLHRRWLEAYLSKSPISELQNFQCHWETQALIWWWWLEKEQRFWAFCECHQQRQAWRGCQGCQELSLGSCIETTCLHFVVWNNSAPHHMIPLWEWRTNETWTLSHTWKFKNNQIFIIYFT